MLKNVMPLTIDDETQSDWSEYHIIAEKTLKKFNDAMLSGKPRDALHLSLDLIEVAHNLKHGALEQI